MPTFVQLSLSSKTITNIFHLCPVQGQYSYNSPEGPVAVQYIADEHGYQPTGPNVHPAIIKAVAQQVAEARAKPLGADY